MASVNSIASHATNMSHAQLKEQIGYAVARKSLDAAKQQGQAALTLLDAAAQVGQQASEPGKGTQVDIRG